MYLAGGVGPSAANEAAGWSSFLGHYGLAFASSYNGLNSVAITSVHPIFSGITTLGSGNGQSILSLGTNPNAEVVQFSGAQGVYAVVSVPAPVPEPMPAILLGGGLLALVARRRLVTAPNAHQTQSTCVGTSAGANRPASRVRL